jgi:curved DNA-binding protein
MEYKDYYKTLGIERNATDKDIKKAYRRLARKHHPDVNPGDKGAEERFKEINEANEVLTDPEKRRKYDELGSNWQQWERTGQDPRNFDWSQYFSGAQQQRGGPQAHTEYVDLNDLFGGGGGEAGGASDFFESLFGGMRQGRGGAQGRRRQMPGQDVEQPVEITLEEAAQGTARVMQLDSRRIEIKIPAGVDTGSRVRIAGEGAPGMGGGQKGDLYLVVSVLPHATFKREGNDLRCEAPVDLYTALLGGEVRVPTLTGGVMLKIPPETQNGQTVRLRGQGMPDLKKANTRGDLFVTIKVLLPQKLSSQETQLFQELALLRASQGMKK